jgi:RND superfamily putative drug exporter
LFSSFGDLLNRTWIVVLVGWVALIVALRATAPEWNEVAKDGQFSFLPDDSPSRRADELFNQAFPQDLLASSVVIVVSREEDTGLTDDDRQFVSGTLKPRLKELAGNDEFKVKGRPIIGRVRSFDDELVGSLMLSQDGKATLVLLEFTHDFFSQYNRPAIAAIEGLLEKMRRDQQVPDGLDLQLTGIATVGRDITRASHDSAQAIGRWTIILVVSLTLVVFRAPLLALIPLITLFFAMEVALKSLSLLAEAGIIGIFQGIESYSTVVVYASGVDYSLFLISRFKEELGGGSDIHGALRNAVGKVGAAIAASAATEVAGIGMMAFARFGKFHEAGIAIAFSLAVMLVAVLTLTPALLHLFGRWSFWPYHQPTVVAHGAGGTRSRLDESRFERIWESIADAVLRRPATFWLVTTASMIPFAVVGMWWYNHLNYDLVGNLPRHAPSVAGTKKLEEHFPAGTMAPVNLLIKNEAVDFRSPDGIEAVEELTKSIDEHRDELQVADVRSLAAPLGTSLGKSPAEGGTGRKLLTAAAVRRRAINYYVSTDSALANHVTRLELELTLDPFSEKAIDFLDPLEKAIREQLPAELKSGSELYFSGSTASLHDLKVVGAADRTLINVLVVASVFIILVMLLRRFWLIVYLLATVLFGYLVTVGATLIFFYLRDQSGFPGLDWTVPLFLFTVLIAIGEDYNILLVTRIHEEQEAFGPERGIAVGLARTGPIISSCGFIMAGTFLSLMIAGELGQLTQLGFALAFGVILDTFIIRPILVPAFMLMIERWRHGSTVKSDTAAAVAAQEAPLGSLSKP